jgi:hypothetical protein
MIRIGTGLLHNVGARLSWTALSLLATLALASAPARLWGQGPVHLTLRAQTSLDSLRDPDEIVDAAQDTDGTIYMLDARSRVTIVDRHLALLGAFGTPGGGSAGPRYPVSIGMLRDGRFAVQDEGRFAIAILRADLGGGRLMPLDTVAIRPFGRGMCVLRDGTFLVYGANAGMRVHIYGPGGRLLRSFAPADSTLDYRVQDQLAMGRIGCNEDRDEVVLTSAFLPAVEAYRITTGRRIWVGTLRPYRPTEITIRSRGMTLASGPGGHSVVVTVLVLRGCRLLQARYLGRQDGAGVDTVVTYLFRDSATAPTVRLDVPLLVSAGSGRVLSLPAAQSVMQLQDVSVDGCEGGAAARSVRH